MNKKDFGVIPDIEPILYMQKREKNREKMGRKGDNLVPLTDISIYKVDFKLDNTYITAGYMMSALEPTGEDFLDLTPINSLREKAEELVKAGVIDNIDKMWEAYTLCSKNPELIKYTKLSREEGRDLLGIEDCV
jgi:hypothetical protein